MSKKNYDNHNRWRNKTVAFRVSAEEDLQLETLVKLTGLTKQDYISHTHCLPDSKINETDLVPLRKINRNLNIRR